MSKNNDLIVPLRVSREFVEWVDQTSDKIGLNRSDTMRKAMEEGLETLEEKLTPAFRRRGIKRLPKSRSVTSEPVAA